MSERAPLPLDVRLTRLAASLLFALCAALALAALAGWLLRHPGFAIARIVVQGPLHHHDAASLRAQLMPYLAGDRTGGAGGPADGSKDDPAAPPTGDLKGNFFTLDLRAARAVFEQLPWVRSAQLRRVYPGSLYVELQEHEALAYWGPEAGAALLNRQGEVFEAPLDAIEQDALPRLQGPAAASAPELLRMHGLLTPIFQPLGLGLQALELDARGSWRATLGRQAQVELGGGTAQQVVQRAQRFARSLAQAAAKYGRRADALESADLRHSDGYALRLRGVSTVEAGAAAAAHRG